MKNKTEMAAVGRATIRGYPSASYPGTDASVALSRVEHLAISCPTCGAAEGEPCRSKKSGPAGERLWRDSLHSSRRAPPHQWREAIL